MVILCTTCFLPKLKTENLRLPYQKIAWRVPRGLAGLALLAVEAWHWDIKYIGTETIIIIFITLHRAQLLSSKHVGNYVSDDLEEV